MKMVPIKHAKDRFSELIRCAESGEEIVITRNGKPVVTLARTVKRGLDWEALRRWKADHGYESVVGPIPADFDDPLPEDFLIRLDD